MYLEFKIIIVREMSKLKYGILLACTSKFMKLNCWIGINLISDNFFSLHIVSEVILKKFFKIGVLSSQIGSKEFL
jgi:hypothetical protein